jgi:hypothetical protein
MFACLIYRAELAGMSCSGTCVLGILLAVRGAAALLVRPFVTHSMRSLADLTICDIASVGVSYLMSLAVVTVL